MLEKSFLLARGHFLIPQKKYFLQSVKSPSFRKTLSFEQKRFHSNSKDESNSSHSSSNSKKNHSEFNSSSIPEKPDLEIPSTSNSDSNSRWTKWLFFILPITCFGLGTWQIQRWEQKKEMLQKMENKEQEPPIPLPQEILE